MASSEFCDVYAFGVALGSLCIKSQGYVPVLLANLCGMSCSGTCWLLSGAWISVSMETFGWPVIAMCSLESGVLWCSQAWDLSLLPLVFSLILTAASRLLHPYSTND